MNKPWYEESPKPDFEKMYRPMTQEDRELGRSFKTYKGRVRSGYPLLEGDFPIGLGIFFLLTFAILTKAFC